jgi:L-asparaginase/Glu-tRNA(Gln) amidotransferase subunit D
MATFPEDLIVQLVAEAVGTAAVNLHISSKSASPKTDAPNLFILETGGTSSLRTQDKQGDAYENPSAQILVRGKEYAVVRAMLSAAYDALVKVRNTTLNGTWYVEIRGLQKFIDLGLDENGHVRVAFNVLATKRP